MLCMLSDLVAKSKLVGMVFLSGLALIANEGDMLGEALLSRFYKGASMAG